MAEQTTSNLVICFALSVLSGLLVSIGVNFVAYDVHKTNSRKPENENDDPPTGGCCVLLLNIFFNLAGIAAFVAASGYGPVAIAMPVETAALLLSNLFIMKFFDIGAFDGTCLVGTLVLVSAATCLGDCGPADSTAGSNGVARLHRSAVLWIIFMMAALLGSLSLVCWRSRQPKAKDKSSIGLLVSYAVLAAVTTSMGASVGKILTLTAGTKAFYGFALAYFLLGIGSLGSGALAARHCDQAIYLPLSECIKLILNAVTGYFVWLDKPAAPMSYLMVYVQMCLAVYLCSSMDKASQCAQPEVAKRLTRRFSSRSEGSEVEQKLLAAPSQKQLYFGSQESQEGVLQTWITGYVGWIWIARLLQGATSDEVQRCIELFNEAKAVTPNFIDGNIGIATNSFFNRIDDHQMEVKEATVDACNGIYTKLEERHNNKNTYKNENGALMYYDKGWKINKQGNKSSDSFEYAYDCSYFEQKGVFPANGEWTGSDGKVCKVDTAAMEESRTLYYFTRKSKPPPKGSLNHKMNEFANLLDTLIEPATVTRLVYRGAQAGSPVI